MKVTTRTADEALQRLVEGNQRFLRGEARFPTVRKELWRTWQKVKTRSQPFWGAATPGCHRS